MCARAHAYWCSNRMTVFGLDPKILCIACSRWRPGCPEFVWPPLAFPDHPHFLSVFPGLHAPLPFSQLGEAASRGAAARGGGRRLGELGGGDEGRQARGRCRGKYICLTSSVYRTRNVMGLRSKNHGNPPVIIRREQRAPRSPHRTPVGSVMCCRRVPWVRCVRPWYERESGRRSATTSPPPADDSSV